MLLSLPISIQLGKRNCSLNLNFYRNAHYQILNKMKVAFANQVRDQILPLPVFEHVSLTYTLFPKTRRLCDVANVCTVVDKFFCDALVTEHKLKDDNYNYVRRIEYRFGEVDPSNPRVTVEIKGTPENADYPHPE